MEMQKEKEMEKDNTLLGANQVEENGKQTSIKDKTEELKEKAEALKDKASDKAKEILESEKTAELKEKAEELKEIAKNKAGDFLTKSKEQAERERIEALADAKELRLSEIMGGLCNFAYTNKLLAKIMPLTRYFAYVAIFLNVAATLIFIFSDKFYLLSNAHSLTFLIISGLDVVYLIIALLCIINKNYLVAATQYITISLASFVNLIKIPDLSSLIHCVIAVGITMVVAMFYIESGKAEALKRHIEKLREQEK